MRKLYYVGLEKYESRYTLQLEEWNRRVFDNRDYDVQYVTGANLDKSQTIVNGQVLDCHGRSFFALTQMSQLTRYLQEGAITADDVIYFEDMFTPGMEILPYIFNQTPKKYHPKVFVRCLAQSIDPDDFVHVHGMQSWMSKYEKMLNEWVTGILCSSEEMVAHAKIAGWKAPLYNISGLAFGKHEVQSRVKETKYFNHRTLRVTFSSRWDQEKQPNFYMDLIEEYNKYNAIWGHKFVEFALFCGGELRSNDSKYIDRAKELEKQGLLKIYENLSKNQYYELLNDTRVLFNCALQDWVSNTVSEADALGCNVLFPAYRSFPEIFNNDGDRMYVPWSLDDAINKLIPLLDRPHVQTGQISDWTDGTIDRICDILEGNGEAWRRDSKTYRNHLAESKY